MATAVTDSPTVSLFDQSRLLHRSAPSRLTEKWRTADAADRWELWQRHLARRKQPRPLSALAGKRPSVLWCWPTAWQREAVATSADEMAAHPDQLADHAAKRDDLPGALEAVAAAYALPELAALLGADAWSKLTEALHDLAVDSDQWQIDVDRPPEELLRQQLLVGELPLVLSYLFPELAPLRSLAKPATQALSDIMLGVHDGRGTPHGRLVPVLGPLLASWTRCRQLGQRLKRGCWSRAAELEYCWLVRRALRLADGDRRFLFDGNPDASHGGEMRALLATALELAGDDADFAAAAAVAPTLTPQSRRTSARKLPKASLHAEWSGLAVLAADWSRRAPRLAVTYAEDPLLLELHVGGEPILAGPWATETRAGGRALSPIGPWEEVCWQSDEDCDYLELSIELADGLELARQILLAKQDEVLYLADVVLTDGMPRELSHTVRLPLGPHVTWHPEDETRDGLLKAGKQRVAMLPLGLKEWRVDPRGGRLEQDDRHLVLSHQAHGRALCCPWLLDLNPRRSKKQRTWRQLTVAELLEVVPDDVAVGYRGQSGRDQWLFYRSLGPAGNRTVLGQNIASEFFAGRFLPSGEADEWIEIEVDP